MFSIDPRIFRAYDIRGRADEQITKKACLLIGRAFGTELREKTGKASPRVCVGRDARTHGPKLEQSVIDGLLQSGCTVLHIGQTPSPAAYFTVQDQKLDGGIQVTASHNPAHDNGLKLCTAGANAFSGDDLQRLRERIERGDFADGKGTIETYDAEGPYLKKLDAIFGQAAKGMRIAVDGGNGVAGPLYVQALKNAGATVTGLFIEPDGTFPHHPADPSKHATLKDLQRALAKNPHDLGLAFDGDGDRVGLVDERGKIRSADEILLLLARDHLSRHPGSPVIFTVSNSGMLQSEIEKWGGRPVMCKVGHSFVEHAMHEHHAMLGGEQSGHFFCGEDYYGYDDALAAALRLCAIINTSGKNASELFEEFPAVYQSQELRPHVSDDDKTRVIGLITEHFAKDHEVITLDGVRVEFGNGAWAGIRQSNTSPCISICMEARSREGLKEVEEIVLGHLKKYPEIQWQE